jgi:hypothetical protein
MKVTFLSFMLFDSSSCTRNHFYTHPHPPLKMDENVIKKLNWILPNVTSKIWTKSIWPMACALNNCFCRQKAKMNFITQSNFKNMDNFKLIFSSYSTVFAHTVTRFDILYQLLPYFQNF